MEEPFESLQAALKSRYRIEREIGRGGSAFVFAAQDLQHQRPVAIKLMRSELVVSPERFQREILLIARLQHPNIVPLFDSGQVQDVPYYVMPLVEGESLRKQLEAKRVLPVERAIDIALEIADALEYAHAKGLLHRDVKPENILLSGGHAMLSDFGIARAVAQSASSHVTGGGIALGTPAYMSPEQAAGADIDPRSDQYSLACVVYEMLSGEIPVRAFTPPSPDERSANSGPDLRKLRRDVPRSVAMALSRALSRDPQARFASATDFSSALLGSVPPGNSSGAKRIRASANVVRPGARLVVGSLVTVLGVTATVLALQSRGDPAPERPSVNLDPRRVAVLYFDDHSADRSLGHVASGLTEGLIHELSAVGPLQVISRNGVKPFRDGNVSLDSIARLLQVGSIVEGSVQRSENRIRVTVQLIDARTGVHRGSKEIIRELGELFLLEDELARTVASEFRRTIGLELRMREHVAATRSVSARELVWRADRERDRAAATLAGGRSSEDVRKAAELVRRADSLLAAAEREDRQWITPIIDRGWVAWEIGALFAGAARDSAFEAGMAHAQRALRRDTTNAAALELRGTWLYTEAERGTVNQQTVAAYLARAERDLRRAIDIDSTLATAWGTLSRVRRAAGDIGDAERMATTALAMDAYLRDAPSILSALFSATLMNDSLDASWRWCRRGAADYPGDVRFVQCQLTLLAEDARGPADADSARTLVKRAAELDPPERALARGRPWQPIYRDMMLAIVLARAGARDSALSIAARARRGVQDHDVMRVDLLYEQALLQLVLGDRAGALRLLSDYLTERPYLRGLVAKHPRWKPLRADPAFASMVTARGATTSPRQPY